MNKSSKQSRSGHVILQVSAAIMATFVLLIFYATLAAKEWLLVAYAVPYSLTIGGAQLSLRGKVKSETVQRLILLLNIVGAASVFFIVWVYFSFLHSYTW